MADATIGFIGAGYMGRGIAARLIGGGRPLMVLANRSRAGVEALIALGAEEAADAAALAARCETVVLCLPGSPAVAAVVDALSPDLRAGALIIDVTTADPVATAALQRRLGERGIGFVDAPVTGGPAQAEAGTLTSLVGGGAEDVARARPLIETYSRSVQVMGGPGAGLRAKLLNNMVTIGAVCLIVQAYRAARAEDLDWGRLYEAMMGGAARSGTLQKMIGPALEGDFEGHQFSLGNAIKDISYAEAYLTQIGAPPDIVAEMRRFLEGEAETRDADSVLSQLLRG